MQVWTFVVQSGLDNIVVHAQTRAEHSTRNLSVIVIADTEGGDSFSSNAIIQKFAVLLKHPKNSMSENEWIKVLRYVLLGEQRPGEDTIVVEARDRADSPSTLTLEIKLVQGEIKHLLGSVRLDKQDSSKANELLRNQRMFEACVLMGQKVHQQARQSQKVRQQLDRTNAQLDELITAKDQFEHELLDKFVLLLNEKKDKIRELRFDQSYNSKRKLDQETVESSQTQSVKTDYSDDRKVGLRAELPQSSPIHDRVDKMDSFKDHIKEEPFSQSNRTTEEPETEDETESESE